MNELMRLRNEAHANGLNRRVDPVKPAQQGVMTQDAAEWRAVTGSPESLYPEAPTIALTLRESMWLMDVLEHPPARNEKFLQAQARCQRDTRKMDPHRPALVQFIAWSQCVMHELKTRAEDVHDADLMPQATEAWRGGGLGRGLAAIYFRKPGSRGLEFCP